MAIIYLGDFDLYEGEAYFFRLTLPGDYDLDDVYLFHSPFPDPVVTHPERGTLLSQDPQEGYVPE